MDIFSVRFKELKKHHSYTYPQIAEHLKIKTGTVKSYASGAIKPDYYKLLSIADYFDVSIDYLVGRSDDPKRR